MNLDSVEKFKGFYRELKAAVGGIETASDDDEKKEGGEGILGMLVKALADELLAENQYWVCRHLARGNGRIDAIPEFEEHEKDEREHAEKLMLRIKELGGKPITSPAKWEENANPWTEPDTEDVCKQLEITIKAEQDAIDFYKRIAEECRNQRDEVSLKVVRSILEDEEEHLYDLSMLKEEVCGEDD